MNRVFGSVAAALALSGMCVEAAAASPDESRANAARAEEIAQIREQLQSLMQRVDRLEQENSALKAQNEVLQAQGDSLTAETRGLRQDSAARAAGEAKAQGADWAQRVVFKGDLRYRHEQISDDSSNAAGVQATADRERQRVRARLNAEIKATENIDVGIGFATNEGGDPRSSNQTLTDVFSRKSITLDTAYFDWRFSDWGHLIGGKMKQPFVNPGQSLFWDSDVNPEGLALAFERGVFFGTAYGFWIDEVSAAQNAVTADTMLFGGQFGARLPLGASDLTLAAHYYDLSAGQGRAPFFDGSANGNTTIAIGVPGTAVLLNDYQVVNLMAELNTAVGDLPLQLWTDMAQNRDAGDQDMAWSAGVLLGKAGDFRTWEVGAAYQRLEKDALFAQLIDADFGGGVSDTRGWVLRGAYAPVKNWVLNATWYMTERNVDAANAAGQTGVDYDRLQLDFNTKF